MFLKSRDLGLDFLVRNLKRHVCAKIRSYKIFLKNLTVISYQSWIVRLENEIVPF